MPWPCGKPSALRCALLVWLLAGMLCSCGLWGGQKNDEQALLLAADRFNKDLQWEDYRAAASLLAPSDRESFWELVDRLQGQVRIMDYQVVDVILTPEGRSGTVTLRYRYYLKRNPQLQTTTVHQKWVFSEKERRWQVVKNDVERLIP